MGIAKTTYLISVSAFVGQHVALKSRVFIARTQHHRKPSPRDQPRAHQSRRESRTTSSISVLDRKSEGRDFDENGGDLQSAYYYFTSYTIMAHLFAGRTAEVEW